MGRERGEEGTPKEKRDSQRGFDRRYHLNSPRGKQSRAPQKACRLLAQPGDRFCPLVSHASQGDVDLAQGKAPFARKERQKGILSRRDNEREEKEEEEGPERGETSPLLPSMTLFLAPRAAEQTYRGRAFQFLSSP